MALVVRGLGDALVDVLIKAVEHGRPKLRAAAECIEDVVRPPPGARIVTDGGGVFSGVVVFDRNEPKIWVAVRLDDPPAALSAHSTPPPPPNLSTS